MSEQTDALIQRRRQAMAARQQGKVPVVEPPEIPDEESVSAALGSQARLVAETTPKSRSVALPVADPSRSIDASDMVMPKLKISQAMSKVNTDDVVRQGNFYHTTMNDNLGKSILVVPVDMYKSRGYFVNGKGLMCRSFDMIQGEGDPGILCEGTEEERYTVPAQERGCSLRLWPDKSVGGGPPCGISYNYPVLILDADNPDNGPVRRAVFSVRGTATKMARALNTIVTEGDYRWHEVVLRLTLQQTSNTKGAYYVPSVEFVQESAGTVREKAARFATQVNAAAIRATVESGGED